MQLRTRFLRAISRVTSTGRLIPQIDGLRFVAIAWVVLFHLSAYLMVYGATRLPAPSEWGPLTFIARRGFAGVQLFFAISGFILALPFAEQHLTRGSSVSLRSYFLRRLTRLEPPYLLNLVVIYALLVVVKHQSARELFPHFLASASYTHNQVYASGSAINFVAWTLEIEIQFYVLMPLFARCFLLPGAWARRSAIAALGLCPLLLRAAFDFDPRWNLSILSGLPFFMVGMLLADLQITAKRPASGNGLAWDGAGALAFAGLPAVVSWEASSGKVLLSPFLVLLAYCGVLRGRWLSQFFANRWVVGLGGMCYTVYLYHVFVISLLAGPLVRWLPGHGFESDLALAALVLVPLVFLVSAPIFVLTEKPFMKRDWLRRLLGSVRSEAEVPSRVAK
jgi:peptidoglycan/LPS O-acetylase OafA/YrhL